MVCVCRFQSPLCASENVHLIFCQLMNFKKAKAITFFLHTISTMSGAIIRCTARCISPFTVFLLMPCVHLTPALVPPPLPGKQMMKDDLDCAGSVWPVGA